MKNRRRSILGSYCLLSPLLAGCLLFYIAPFGLVLFYSFTRGTGKTRYFAGLSNYQALLSNSVFQTAFGNTLKFLGVSLPLMLALAYLVALLLRWQAERHRVLKSVLMLPYILPVAGLVLLVEGLLGETGLLNRVLAALGIPVVQWLSGPAAFWVMVLLYLWKNLGYSVVLLLAGLMAIPPEQYSCSELDGAGPLAKFWWITTPQMWASVFFTLVFSMMNAFRCFREIFLIGGNTPIRAFICCSISSTADLPT